MHACLENTSPSNAWGQFFNIPFFVFLEAEMLYVVPISSMWALNFYQIYSIMVFSAPVSQYLNRISYHQYVINEWLRLAWCF